MGENVHGSADIFHTVPEILDLNSESCPERPFYVFSRDIDAYDAPTRISQREVANASHRAAYAFRVCANTDGKSNVVAVLAHVDTLVYHTALIGLMRIGAAPFPMSPRNSVPAIINLLRRTGCTTLVGGGAALTPLLQTVKTQFKSETAQELTIGTIPPLSELYPKLGAETADDSSNPYPPLTTRPKLDDVAFLVHSSGSTGLPKHVPITHGMLRMWLHLPCHTDEGISLPEVRMAGMAPPPFHMIGLVLQLFRPVLCSKIAGIYPPMEPAPPIFPTSDNLLEHARRTGSNCLLAMPAFLEAWASSEKAIDFLQTLAFVSYGGGPLVPEKGRYLASKGVRLQSSYGGSEIGPITHLAPRNEDLADGDWRWARMWSGLTPRYVPQDEPGVYELQFVATESHMMSVLNMQDPPGFSTSDLVERHPTKPELFNIVGRVDDVIVLSSGEKVVPTPMEATIAGHPRIAVALVFGRERSEVGVLVEPMPGQEPDRSDPDWLSKFRQDIWPVVERANAEAPAFGRVFKEMIIVTNPGRPMARAPKGTPVRKLATKQYEKEIEALYETIEPTKVLSAGSPDDWSPSGLQTWLVEECSQIHEGKDIELDKDLFEQGFDSLSATFLRNRIRGALSSQNLASAAQVDQNFVFTHPTIGQLVAAMAALSHHVTSDIVSYANRHIQAIETMVEKYTEGLLATNISSRRREGTSVFLLTGSTGGLGSHLLATLLQREDVFRVYALNRASSTQVTLRERQKVAFRTRGLDEGFLSSEKLVLVEADLSLANLGIATDLYNDIMGQTTAIIHNAWRLDFNLGLQSFKSQVQSVRNLIDLGLHAPLSKFIFISSVAVAQSWSREEGKIPEGVLEAKMAIGSGYGEAKYVGERILAASSLPATSVRIGQITGGKYEGTWAVSDWVPILIKSSISMGFMPTSPGTISWITPEVASGAILEVALSDNSSTPVVLNLLNPRKASWNAIIHAIMRNLAKQGVRAAEHVRPVPYAEWYAELEKLSSTATSEDLKKIPAIKLLSTFAVMNSSQGAGHNAADGLKDFEISTVQSISNTLARAEAVGEADTEKWVKYWVAQGLFSD